MSEPHVAQVELRAPCGAQPKSWALHGGRLKSAKQTTKEQRRAWRSDRQPLYGGRFDRLGSRSDRQPLFQVRSNHVGSRSDHQPLFSARLDRPDMWSDHQLRPAVESPVEYGASAVMRTWEPYWESQPIEKCLNH
jgi:hypothetical protein